MMPGAACTCGALIFGTAPEVHNFLAMHPVTTAKEFHNITALVPETSAQYTRIQRAYARLLTAALTARERT
jgi:hypothetical protein